MFITMDLSGLLLRSIQTILRPSWTSLSTSQIFPLTSAPQISLRTLTSTKFNPRNKKTGTYQATTAVTMKTKRTPRRFLKSRQPSGTSKCSKQPMRKRASTINMCMPSSRTSLWRHWCQWSPPSLPICKRTLRRAIIASSSMDLT